MQAMSSVQSVQVGSSDAASFTVAEMRVSHASPVQATVASPALFDATGALVRALPPV